MASVTSLDKDLRTMRLDKYTPQAAKEVSDWIEEVLGKGLQRGDLLDALRDGLVLCSLVNKAVSPGVKAKPSNMPFVQRENISLFVRACQTPPFSLQDHDIFLTDDLYEAKDPTQVLQCITAFSRRAHAVNPAAFPRAIGAKSKMNLISPQRSGARQNTCPRPPIGLPGRERGSSNASDPQATTWNPLAKSAYARGISPTKGPGSISPPGHVSSWSTKPDEGKTAPAWNIHQYGYMGGASQGNQGIAFGARRQITSASPPVPSLAEKERRRRGEAEEADRQRLQTEEAEQRIRLESQAAEERSRLEEEQRWREETRREGEKERAEAEAEAEAEERRWEEEQRRLKQEEHQQRLRREQEREARWKGEHGDRREDADNRLRGQFLSQYQAEETDRSPNQPSEPSRVSSENERIKHLEKELALAKERELQHQLEREERLKDQQSLSPEPARQPGRSVVADEDDWQATERGHLRKEWERNGDVEWRPRRELPRGPATTNARPAPSEQLETGESGSHSNARPRPLPDPSAHAASMNRTDRHLAQNPAPAPVQARSHRPADYSTTTEVDLEHQGRQEGQVKTKAGGWASKSLLEREMERERERQREWEEAQNQTAQAPRDQQEGTGPGQSWSVHQYGYMGGDSQNRGGPGLGVGGARRQIIGPRPQR